MHKLFQFFYIKVIKVQVVVVHILIIVVILYAIRRGCYCWGLAL